MNSSKVPAVSASTMDGSLRDYRLQLLALASAAALAPKAEGTLVNVTYNHVLDGSSGQCGCYFNPVDASAGALFIANFRPTGIVTGYYGTFFFSATQGLELNFRAACGAAANVLGCGSATMFFFTATGATVGVGSPEASPSNGVRYFSYGVNYGSTYYIGLRMSDQGAGSSDTYYGWASFQILSSSSAKLLELVYDDTHNATVTIGAGSVAAIPEPAHAVALLSAGALGLAAFRRRRQQAAAAIDSKVSA